MKNWSRKNNNNNLIKNLSSKKFITIYDNNNFNNYNYLLMLTKKRKRSYKKNYNIYENDSLRDSHTREGNIVEKNLRKLFLYKFNLKQFSNEFFNYKFYYFLSLYKNNDINPLILFNRNDKLVEITEDLKFLTKKNLLIKKNKSYKPNNNIFNDGSNKYEVKVEKIEFDMIATNKKKIFFNKNLNEQKNNKENKDYKNMNILFPDEKDTFEIPKKSILLGETKINNGKKEFKEQFLRNIKILNQT